MKRSRGKKKEGKAWWSSKDRRRTTGTEYDVNDHWLTCVTLVTVADNLSVTVVLVTRCGKVASAVGPIRTGARTALAYAQNRVAIVTIGTPTDKTKGFTELKAA